MAKRKQSKWVRGIWSAAGLLFICGAVYFFIHGIHTYVQQIDRGTGGPQRQRLSMSTSAGKAAADGRTRSHHTVYDIYYQYEADGGLYTDVIYGMNAGKKYGESFAVKYDPEAPQNATHHLQPDPG